MAEVGGVTVGSVVFALIDPTPGHEVAFNHWYERDHYYATGTSAPGVFAASRYVAPRWCKELRRPSDAGVAGDPARGSHLALYFVMDGHDADRVAWAAAQVALAAEEDRLFSEREHLHTWSYALEWSWVDHEGGGVPAPLALDHRYTGASVVLLDIAEGVSPAEAQSALRGEWDGCDDAVAVVLSLVPTYELMSSTWIGEIDAARRRTLVCFHDGDVAEGWAASRGRFDGVEAQGLTTVAWASPFVINRFGTDRYVDEL